MLAKDRIRLGGASAAVDVGTLAYRERKTRDSADKCGYASFPDGPFGCCAFLCSERDKTCESETGMADERRQSGDDFFTSCFVASMGKNCREGKTSGLRAPVLYHYNRNDNGRSSTVTAGTLL